LLVTACTSESDPLTEPDGAVLRLFELAGESPRELEALFGPLDDARVLAALGDALDELARAGRPEIVAVEPLDVARKTAVDVVAQLPGGGQAGYTVQLEMGPDGRYRVVWLGGPGVEWPLAQQGRGDPLTTQPELNR